MRAHPAPIGTPAEGFSPPTPSRAGVHAHPRTRSWDGVHAPEG